MPRRIADHLRALDSREEKLDTLLENYNDAQETLQLGDGPGDNSRGDRLLLMPLVWNMSYRKLEKLLKFMRHLAEEPGEASPQFRARYFHLCQWYLRSERKRVPMMRKDKKGRLYHLTTGTGPQFELIVRRGSNPNPTLVLEGLEWLSGHFPGEIYLPKELLSDKMAA